MSFPAVNEDGFIFCEFCGMNHSKEAVCEAKEKHEKPGLILRDGTVLPGSLNPKHRFCVVCLQEPVDISYGLAFEDGERRLARRFCGPCVKAIQEGLATRIVETRVLYRLLEDVRE